MCFFDGKSTINLNMKTLCQEVYRLCLSYWKFFSLYKVDNQCNENVPDLVLSICSSGFVIRRPRIRGFAIPETSFLYHLAYALSSFLIRNPYEINASGQIGDVDLQRFAIA